MRNGLLRGRSGRQLFVTTPFRDEPKRACRCSIGQGGGSRPCVCIPRLYAPLRVWNDLTGGNVGVTHLRSRAYYISAEVGQEPLR
jgi:hypothetical protein